MPESNFYLGRIFDPKSAKVTMEAIEYDPADLTTHGVVTGMTGSGKTGLCVALLEEAALQGIPAIIIDPKGDLTNLLMHFPKLEAGDFAPWIDPEMVRRAGKTLEEAAGEAAGAWRTGLKTWGIEAERLARLGEKTQFTIFTPGSETGAQVSVLSSLMAPDVDWDENREALRERIASTVTALLGLAGLDALNPIQSREHILLSNLFETQWSAGRDIELTELILQIQTPPFEKLGAFAVDTFFPPKERMELAMALNNILAAPAFEAWREGEALDAGQLLFTAEGKPRHSVFYLAHLSDSERMFFVTLLLSAVESWMRTQKGSTSLRALLYMDEIFGYLPPTAMPPSKAPLLRMLKQARAFGLGLLLATQNPVDLDYKALSNAGTWWVGKLQTERDKMRLLDGLEGAAGGISRQEMDGLLSSLGKRVFVMHNVHAKAPILMQTRWTMNFLAGPMTRAQIPALNALAGAVETRQDRAVKAGTPGSGESPVKRGAETRGAMPAGVREYFLPQNLSLAEGLRSLQKEARAGMKVQGVLYRPCLLAAAQVRIVDRKYGVEAEVMKTALVESPERRGVSHWEDFPYPGGAPEKLEDEAMEGARFGELAAPLNDAKAMKEMQKDFAEWVFRNTEVTARANAALKVFAGPDVSQAEFMKACTEAAREGREAELEKKAASVDKKIKSLRDKLAREQRELRQDEEDLKNRKLEAGLNGAEVVASLFGLGRKKSLSTPVSKMRMAQNAKEDVRESEETIAEFEREIAALEREREQVAAEVNDYWGDRVNEVEEISIRPKKTDVFVEMFGVAWKPFYLVDVGGETLEVPACGGKG